MTSISRTVTTSILDWRGLLIRVTFEKQRTGDHLTIESIEPQRAPLPVTPLGYASRFVPKNEPDDPAAYVEAWLDQAAKTQWWGHLEMGIRQYDLL